jgi:hypothetical protein
MHCTLNSGENSQEDGENQEVWALHHRFDELGFMDPPKEKHPLTEDQPGLANLATLKYFYC